MRAQSSLEYVLDVSVVIVIVAFLLTFFSAFTNPHTNAAVMSNLCSVIAQSINSVANGGGFSSVVYSPLLNMTTFRNYNISVSNGVVLIYLLSSTGKIPNALIANTNIISCGANTRLTNNESFKLSNLALYKYNNVVNLAYLYANYSSSNIPIELFGGGFSGNVTLYLAYPNSTMSFIATNPSPFSYNSTDAVAVLPPGSYSFYAQDSNNRGVHVILPFVKS